MKTLYMMVGLPGSGKSTFAKNFAKVVNADYISRDEIRLKYLTDDDDYFKYENDVFTDFCNLINKSLHITQACVADATHLSYGSRKKLLQRIDSRDLKVVVIVVQTSLETCIKRQASRSGRRKVPEDTIRQMIKAFKMPALDEDFTYARIVSIQGE